MRLRHTLPLVRNNSGMVLTAVVSKNGKIHVVHFSELRREPDGL
jgi:hypothetical protein